VREERNCIDLIFKMIIFLHLKYSKPGDAKLSGRNKLIRFDEAEHLQPSLIFASKLGNLSVHGTIQFTSTDT
jgi:hypothetical protein